MISDVHLTNFRSYTDSAFEFGDGVNIIVGPNASGKTNLLESILVLCTGSSYRVKDVELIRFDQPWCRLESDSEGTQRKVTIENVCGLAQKKFSIDGAIQKRLLLNKKLPVVLFEPDHLRLLQGSPERRRDYLDGLLEQTVTGYGTLRREYRRTLAQRNALLKSPTRPQEAQLFVWNVRLSELGGKIVSLRAKTVDMLNKNIEALYGELAHSSTPVRLEYESDCRVENYSTEVLHLLSVNLTKDLTRGFTGNGPHRHDMKVFLKDHIATETASRGESRTLLLALKLLELDFVEKARGKKPILLLDDVFSELDGARRKALTAHLKHYQTFITTTDADIVVKHFIDNCTIIPLG